METIKLLGTFKKYIALSLASYRSQFEDYLISHHIDFINYYSAIVR